jgi:hypothetical protein
MHRKRDHPLSNQEQKTETSAQGKEFNLKDTKERKKRRDLRDGNRICLKQRKLLLFFFFLLFNEFVGNLCFGMKQEIE